MKFKYTLSLLFIMLVFNFVVSAQIVQKINSLNTQVEEYIIKGKIVDEHSNPLPGVTVRIKGTNTIHVCRFFTA